MKTIIALLIVALIGTALTLAFWAVKEWVINAPKKSKPLKNCQKTLKKTE